MTDRTSLPRALAAEALGTLLLVATVVGSGIMADRLTTDTALALLGNTIPTGAILFVLITIFGPISGAHFNPAVSVAMALLKAITWPMAAAYVGAQLVGGIAGTALAHLMFDLSPLTFGTTVRTGGSQWLAEAVATFGLLLTIFAGIRYKPTAIPALVGLYITAAYWFTASTSFANPAVTVARMFTTTFSGIRPEDVLPFILFQCGGALAALVIARWFRFTEVRS